MLWCYKCLVRLCLIKIRLCYQLFSNFCEYNFLEKTRTVQTVYRYFEPFGSDSRVWRTDRRTENYHSKRRTSLHIALPKLTKCCALLRSIDYSKLFRVHRHISARGANRISLIWWWSSATVVCRRRRVAEVSRGRRQNWIKCIRRNVSLLARTDHQRP